MANLPGLRELRLAMTPVTDDGMNCRRAPSPPSRSSTSSTPGSPTPAWRGLKGLHNLDTLDIQQTNVTDAGIVELLGLRKLRTLKFDRSRETGRLVRGLQEAGLLSALTEYRGWGLERRPGRARWPR